MSIQQRLGTEIRPGSLAILVTAVIAVILPESPATCLPVLADEGTVTSRLWGVDGELWSSRSRLPDFSFAGYRRGEELYRIPRESISVKDFGAVGDGVTDDTESFRRALEAGKGKLILIPAGRYALHDLFRIEASGTVLRGAGPDRTVL